MSDEEKKDQVGTGRVSILLEPYIPEGLAAQFANNFSFSNTENEAYLSFYQPEVPFMDEQHRAEKIRNKCVARIVLTPAGLKALTDLLNRVTAGITDKTGNG